eukprot:scaffold22560_cov135-Cylindrotheca_fusiformis.AAC.7
MKHIFLPFVPHTSAKTQPTRVRMCIDREDVENLEGFHNAQNLTLLLLPRSSVYDYVSTGKVNAKLAAPWYSHTNVDELKRERETTTSEGLLARDLSKNLSLSNSKDVDTSVPIKYLLDFTLNRFCRWLRILGIDSVLETEEEEKARTRDGSLYVSDHLRRAIFDRCRQEKRTLVTTSSKLLLRKDCPPGAYLLDTKSLANLELSLVHLLLSHGVQLEPRTFLTRCVVCNGTIKEVKDKDQIKSIFEAHQAPNQLNEEIFEVYQCMGCRQGYWWCEKPNSSASRVKTQATNLLEACIRGGVPIAEDMAMFDFVDVNQIRDSSRDESNLLDERLDVVKWLQKEELTNPFGPMTSAYAGSDGKETLRFTNVTHDFVGHLDHIFFEKDGPLQVSAQLFVPTTFAELNDDKIQNGHLLPSSAWPSDHLAIGCKFEPTPRDGKPSTLEDLSPTKTTDGPLFCGQTISPPAPIMHGQRCGCGCVPAIPSLFEMAELRRQAREKAKNNGS